jgi:hypothetical protein
VHYIEDLRVSLVSGRVCEVEAVALWLDRFTYCGVFTLSGVFLGEIFMFEVLISKLEGFP